MWILLAEAIARRPCSRRRRRRRYCCLCLYRRMFWSLILSLYLFVLYFNFPFVSSFSPALPDIPLSNADLICNLFGKKVITKRRLFLMRFFLSGSEKNCISCLWKKGKWGKGRKKCDEWSCDVCRSRALRSREGISQKTQQQLTKQNRATPCLRRYPFYS